MQQRPTHLLNALLADEEKIQQLKEVAQKAHEHAGKTVATPLSAVVNVLLDDFVLADEIMVLPLAEIQRFLSDDYPLVKTIFPESSAVIEAVLHAEVLGRLSLFNAPVHSLETTGDT